MAPTLSNEESLATAYAKWRRVHPFLPFFTASLAGFAGALALMAALHP